MSTILKILRERKNYSQDEIAEKLGVSRQTYMRYESGSSNMQLDVLKKIAELLDVSYSTIVDDRLPVEPTYCLEKSQQDAIPDVRISIPERNIEKFKQVFLYILGKVGAKPNVGQTVLYKLLYFIDFDYYETYERQLMGLSYIKNTYGPTPVDFTKIIRQMKEQHQIEEVKTEYYKHDMTKYLPLVEPNLEVLNARELEFIDSELDRRAGKTAAELSSLSHKDIPWIGAKNREVLDYEAVFYRTPETSVRTYPEEND